MLDIPDADLSDPRLHLAGTPFVLVEWPSLQVPPATPRVLEALQAPGIQLIIAHPERYRGYDREFRLPEIWRELGAYLQVNHGSLLGRYGETPRNRAITLLEAGSVDLLSSDFHGRAHLSPSITDAEEVFKESGGEEQFDLLTRVNTARILRGEDPLPVPAVSVKQGVWQALRAALRPKER
jgi:protein-tyrosine phosphatase